MLFERARVALFLRLLGAALIACVIADAFDGVWRMHTGKLFPWRHLPGVPLYPVAVLVLEWGLGVVGGAMLLALQSCDWAVRLGLLASAMGLTQRFSNHRSLLLIVVAFVATVPLRLDDPDFAGQPRPNLALVRAQLLIVYAFSVLNKSAHGFLTGEGLMHLFAWSPLAARLMAWGVVLAEITTPTLLLLRPRIGVLAAIVLHVTMGLLLPNVWAFSFTMLAMAVLFGRAAERVRS